MHPGDEGAAETSRVPDYEASSPDSANAKLAQIQESALAKQTDKQGSTDKRDMPNGTLVPSANARLLTRSLSDEPKPPSKSALNTCEVWIGSSKSTDEASARLDDLDEAALLKRDGIAVVYIPLMPNDRRVPGFDPFSVSTWRREVAAEESQNLLDVAEVRSSLHMPPLRTMLTDKCACRRTSRTRARRSCACCARCGCGRRWSGSSTSGGRVWIIYANSSSTSDVLNQLERWMVNEYNSRICATIYDRVKYIYYSNKASRQYYTERC